MMRALPTEELSGRMIDAATRGCESMSLRLVQRVYADSQPARGSGGCALWAQAVKRMFGEYVRAVKKRFMYQEALLKFWAYQQVRLYNTA